MDKALADLPRLRRPAAVNAAQYWLAPERFARRCERLGDRFVVPMPSATGPWLCLTDPEDIKRVFTADTDVLRLGAALAKASPHHLVLGPTGLTNSTAPSTCACGECSSRRSTERAPQLPGDHGAQDRGGSRALALWSPHPG